MAHYKIEDYGAQCPKLQYCFYCHVLRVKNNLMVIFHFEHYFHKIVEAAGDLELIGGM